MVSIGVEKRLQAVREVHGYWNIHLSLLGALPFLLLLVISLESRMQLHHQAVLDRHPCHLHQHVALESLVVSLVRSPRERRRKEGLYLWQRSELPLRNPRLLERRHGSDLLKLAPPDFQGFDEVAVGVDLDRSAVPKSFHVGLPLDVLQVEQLVRHESGLDSLNHATNHGYVARRGEGHTKHANPEIREQLLGRTIRGVQLVDQEVINVLGRGFVQRFVDSEDVCERLLDPHSTRSAHEEVEILPKTLPDFPLLQFSEIFSGNVRNVECPLRFQEAHDVLVRGDEDFRRTPKGLETCPYIRLEDLRFCLGVGADDGQVLDELEELVCNAPLAEIGSEKAVLLFQEGKERGLDHTVRKRYQPFPHVAVCRIEESVHVLRKHFHCQLPLLDPEIVLRPLRNSR
mmetsp:Transcript_13107/g.24888  ORF Transcript_13107/g.24888 Transcript_13107/m.24888 type:complete len:401 (+) Transcript_13107:415-1617(+)